MKKRVKNSSKDVVAPVDPQAADAALRSKRRALYLFVFAFFWWFFGFYGADFLRLCAAHEGFYFTGEFLRTHLCAVGGPLQTLAIFTMQSFALPILGGLVLSLLLCGVIALYEKNFCPGTGTFLYGLAIAVLIAVTITHNKYAVFGLYSLRIYFTIPLGLIAAFFIPLAARSIRARRRRTVFSVLSLFFFYPLAGMFMAFAGIALLADESARRLPSGQKEDGAEKFSWRSSALIMLTVILTPILWYPVFSSVFPVTSVYAVCLFPTFSGDTLPPVAFTIFCLMAATAFLVLLPFLWKILRAFGLIPSFKIVRTDSNKTAAKQTPGDLTKGDIFTAFCLCLLLCAVFWGSRWDRDFRLTIGMATAFEEEDWERILALEERSEEPTMPMILLRRLAQIETGTAVNQFFDRTSYASGTMEIAAISSFRIFGPEILLRHGNVNLANRALMNIAQTIQAPDSPRTLKTQTLGALVNGEYRLAERFFAVFDRSLAQRRWSARWRAAAEVLEHGTEPPNPEAAHDAERIRELRSLQLTENYLGEYATVQYTILYACPYFNAEKISRKYQEMQMIYLLLIGKQDDFERCFAVYYRTALGGGAEPIPTLFQDALLFADFAKSQKHLYPISQKRIDQFKEFRRLVDAGQKNPKMRAEIDKTLEEKFSRTVWHYLLFNAARIRDY